MAQAAWHALKCEAVRRRRQNQPALAIDCLVRAIELTRQSADLSREARVLLNYLADIHLQEGQLTKAEATIRQALQMDLHLPEAGDNPAADDLMILAKVLSQQGRHREAHEAASQALSLFRQEIGTRSDFIAQIEVMVQELRRKCQSETGLVVPEAKGRKAS